MTDTVPAIPAQPIVLRLPHEIDLTNADSIGEQLAAACAPGATLIIADMTATTFCDSRGIHMLVLACQWAKDKGTELRLVATRPGVLRAMELQGADLVLPLYQNMNQALAGPS